MLDFQSKNGIIYIDYPYLHVDRYNFEVSKYLEVPKLMKCLSITKNLPEYEEYINYSEYYEVVC